MGIFEGIKDFYFDLEEKYYNFLDSINDTIPIYSIVDPIDKIIPSFMLAILLFAAVLLTGAILITGFFFPFANDTLTISVQDTDGDFVEGATVIFMRGSDVLEEVETDELGIAKISGIQLDDYIEVRVEKDGYATKTETIIIFDLPTVADMYIERESEAFTIKTIRLVDGLSQPIAESFTLKFHCTDPYAPTIRDVSIGPSDRGVATVRVPNECGTLKVDVLDSSKFDEVFGTIIIDDDKTIYLSENRESFEKGEIIVNVTDMNDNPLDGIQVELYKSSDILDNPNVGPLSVDFTTSGQASFDVFPGAYVVKTYDSSEDYGEESSGRISVEANGLEIVTLTLRDNVKGQIKLRVIDKSSSARIEDAKVKLFYADNEEELTALETNDVGQVEFNISREVDYKAIVTATGYKIGRMGGIRVSEDYTEIKLEKCTPSTCGSLKVQVVDQDNTPIENATVLIYDAGTNFIAGYDQRVSDINGIAQFNNVSSGNYYAFAFKEGFSGRSDAGYFSGDPNEEGSIDLIVAMEVGDGIIGINVKDREGRAISFATIGVFDARTDELIGNDITNADGLKEITMRANKKVYLIISKDDTEGVYAKYITSKKPVIVDTVQEFDIVMEKPIINKDVTVEFLGLYSKGMSAQNVKAGETYKARFKIRVAEDKDYHDIGFHIRTGEDVLMEKDELFIKKVNAPLTSQIRATRFEPEQSNMSEDDYDLTNSDAKWVNLEWETSSNQDIIAGVYEVEAEIEIKNSASLGDKLTLFYRVWGEGNEGRERFPEDRTVGDELYSNTKQEIFQVGIITLCDEEFCFTATVTDLEEGILESITESYNARIFNPYRLQFNITNNSGTTIHNNANLRIDNPDESLLFFEYAITDAETRTTNGLINGYEFPRMDVGNLAPKNSVRIDTEFTTQNAINGIINIRIVSDQVIVFEKNLSIIISSPDELDLEIEPKLYLSGVQNEIEVLVKDKSNNLEINGAIVRIKDKHDNVLDYDITGLDGMAYVTLPGQKPGETFKIEAEKMNYNVKVVSLTVSDKLLDISPSQIGVALNTQQKTEAQNKISIRNVAPYSLIIKSIQLQGNFKNLIDKAQVRNWLDASYRGMTIGSKEKQELVLKTFLSEDAQALMERIDLEGELIIVATNFGQEWLFEIPVKIAIGLGNDVDDPTCLVVTKSEWEVSTSGSPKRTEFQIQNNCTVDGRPVALRDLEAKLDWKSNQIGEYTLDFGEDKVVLRSGYYRLLLGTMQPEQTITAILSFTPFGGVNGVAEADFIIQATNPLDTEDQIIGNHQNPLKTKITAINLAQCLSYDKERIIINRAQPMNQGGENPTGTVTITANEICGEKIDFEIESELSTSPTRGFTLQPGEDIDIVVYAEDKYPGQYGLLLSPKFGSNTDKQDLKNIRIIINEPGCWQLSKYEFDVYDDEFNEFDGFDVANLTNHCVERPVVVTVKTKDFMDALSDGMVWGLATMAITMFNNSSNPQTNIWGGAKEAKSVAEASANLTRAERRLNNAKAKLEKMKNEGASKVQLDAVREEIKALEEKQKAAAKAEKDARNGVETEILNFEGNEYQIVTKKGNVSISIKEKDGSWKKLSSKESAELQKRYTDAGYRTTPTAAGGTTAPSGANSVTIDGGTILTPDYVAGTITVTPKGQSSTVLNSSNFAFARYNNELVKAGKTKVIPRTAPSASGSSAPSSPAPTSGGITAQSLQTYINGLSSAEKTNVESFIQKNMSGDYERAASYLNNVGYNLDQANAYIQSTAPAPVTPAPDEVDHSAMGHLVLPPIQSLVTGLQTAYPQQGYGSSGFGSGFGGATGGVFGIAGNLVGSLFGSNPIGAGISGLLLGTMQAYMGQEEEQSFTILQPDVEVKDIKLVQGAGNLEQEDKDIELMVEGLGGKDRAPTAPQPLVNNLDLLSQGVENFRTIFTNISGFTTEHERPKYSQLKITGERHEYTDKVYSKDDFYDEEGGVLGAFDQDILDKTKTELEEDAPEKKEQRYNLEFHSVPPEIDTPVPTVLAECQSGTKLGKTGYDALPKIKLAWNWSEIKEDTCNEDNENGIYCDGTQFTIALLQKINDLTTYVSQNGAGFECPSPREESPAENEIGSYDIGIRDVRVAKVGLDIKVITTIENTNPGIIDTQVSIKAVPLDGTASVDCENQTLTISAGGTEETNCTFTGLVEKFYQAEVTITPNIACENCEDIQATNRLSKTFMAGETGLRECEPYSTSRLDLFLQATGITGAGADELTAQAKFNATLMIDGYSTDFQRDFDVAQNQTFFDAPDYYKNETDGLGIYFKEPDLFSFDSYSQPNFTLPGPGTYSVIIDIEYEDDSWQLFKENGNPNATMKIKMEKLHGAEPDSPFYYVPFDGLVGKDSGRVGYGVNFAGDSIAIDNSTNPLRTVEIAGSAPINDGVLEVTKSNSFKRMQVDDRGTIAKLSRAGGTPTLLYQPSHATPVILQIDKQGEGDAYAIYQIETLGGPTDVGTTMTYWNGIGTTCRAFNDEIMAQQQFVPDTHGISRRCAPVNDRTKYTLEFCEDPVNYGSVFYETVFYTPQETVSILNLVDAASDSATFIAADEEGDDVFLSGNGVTSRIGSLEDIFELVENGYVCLQETSLNAEFYWNPKKLFETIQDEENRAINSCITN